MRTILSFPLALFAIIFCLSITACGDDDDGSDSITLENLQGKDWGLTAQSNTGIGRGAEIAALFTEEELTENGYSNASELGAELDIFFGLLALQPQPCETNNTLTFLDGGAMLYNFSDDCTGTNSTELFDEGTNYSYSLSNRQLVITGGDDDFPLLFNVLSLNETTLELELPGNVLFTGLEISFAAADEADVSINYVYTAQ